MQNKVYVNQEGLICVEYHGPQDYQLIKDATAQIKEQCLVFREQLKPVLVLSDYTHIGYVDSGGRKASIEEMQPKNTPLFDKAALFGKNVYYTVSSNLLIKATGLGKKVKVFTTKQKAVQWLKR